MSCTPRPLVSISAVRRQEIGSVVHTRQTDLDLILLLDFRPARDIPNSIQIAQSGALDVNADAAFRANSISVNSSLSLQPALSMSLRKVTSLGSNLASVTDLKELKLHTVYAVISEAIKPLQLVGQAA